MKYSTIEVFEGVVTTVNLNRPEVHNAMNELMISELTDVFTSMDKESHTRLIILSGNGKSFCAGADLNYMKSIANYGYDQNYNDGQKLAALFEAVYNCPVPTIAKVHGSAFGGANGLLAACDIVLADENTTFAFSEVKLGIGPATISPFVIKRIGEFNARDLMLTGRRFKGREAEKAGLVNKSLPSDEIDEVIEDYIKEFKSGAPGAVRATKEIILSISGSNKSIDEQMKYTASCIAELRQSEEGQEGMTAFFEKRRSKWVIK